MNKFLKELITNKTSILRLEQNDNFTKEEKLSILGLDSSLSCKYIKYMYYLNNQWYYFKKDDNNGGYPFYIIDELMGSYLAKKIKLPVVDYQIARVKNDYGIASVNFKNESFNYYTYRDLVDYNPFNDSIKKMNILSSNAVNLNNQVVFLDHLFSMFALDIYMLQKDRSYCNLQFQINKNTNEFDIAPLYDFSNCSLKIGSEGLYIKNVIMDFDDISVRSLLRKYPIFQDKLDFLLEQNMNIIWDEICEYYNFRQKGSTYQKITDYYEIKDKSQKQYIKQVLRDVK